MRSIAKFFLILVLSFPSLALAQLAVTELTARADPADARVRPLESLVIQARAYGEVKQADESAAEKVRLQRNGASFQLKDSKGGWLSKPFLFQGKDDESFYQERGSGLGSILLGRATGSFVLQDAALFTASEKTGRYVVEVSLEGKTASIEIEVTPSAPSRRPEEKTNFGQEAGSRPSTTLPSSRKKLGSSLRATTWRGLTSTATGEETTTGSAPRSGPHRPTCITRRWKPRRTGF